MEKIYTWTDEKNREIKLVLNYNTGAKTIYRDGVKFLTHAKNIRHKRYDKGIEKVFIVGDRVNIEEWEDSADMAIPPELIKRIEGSYIAMSDSYELRFNFKKRG